MEEFILIDGDQVIFLPTFGAAIVVPQPGKLAGSGPGTHKGKNLCVDGDEGMVSVAGCIYMTPQYCIPGIGTLKIDSLASDQKAQKTKTGGKAVLLKGKQFNAKFEVQSPAQQPPPGPGAPIPDPMSQYMGHGMFVTTNTMFKGT
jgi:hypothetical protein